MISPVSNVTEREREKSDEKINKNKCETNVERLDKNKVIKCALCLSKTLKEMGGKKIKTIKIHRRVKMDEWSICKKEKTNVETWTSLTQIKGSHCWLAR